MSSKKPASKQVSKQMYSFLDTEAGENTFLRNVGWLWTDSATVYPRKLSSFEALATPNCDTGSGSNLVSFKGREAPCVLE
jgi:hypothetical protein